MEVLRIPRLIDLYQKTDAYKRLSEGSQKLYGIYLRQLADLLPSAPAAEVTRVPHAASGRQHGSRPGAANSFRAVASAMFKWAKKRDLVLVNPCDDIDLPDLGEHDPWPDTMLAAGLAAPDPTTRLIVHMLYYTAQRIGDVVRMRWDDFADGRVRIVTGKTKRLVDMPQHEELAAELERAPRLGQTVLVKDGKPMKEASAATSSRSLQHRRARNRTSRMA
ncbi:tyrosine-type recombinase/integrase [Sphingomonas sp. MMS24-JH45]